MRRIGLLTLGLLLPLLGCKRPDSPTAPGTSGLVTKPAPPVPAATGGGCTNLPEVRLYRWAWNSQMGLVLATGGKQAAAGSLMCEHGVNLKLVREDNTDNMQSLMVAFAEALKRARPADAGRPLRGRHGRRLRHDHQGLE